MFANYDYDCIKSNILKIDFSLNEPVNLLNNFYVMFIMALFPKTVNDCDNNQQYTLHTVIIKLYCCFEYK